MAINISWNGILIRLLIKRISYHELTHFYSDHPNKALLIFPITERGNELVNYIPGIPPTRIADLPAVFFGKVLDVVHTACEALSRVPKV